MNFISRWKNIEGFWEYKRTTVVLIISRNKKIDKELNDAERDFYALLMKLLEREIHVSTGTLHDDEGNPVIRTYMRVFDKRSQSYLENLDQIFDTVLKVDFSVMEDDGEKD